MTQREKIVARLLNPKDFYVKEVIIKAVIGSNYHYIEWEDGHTIANWAPSASLKTAKAKVREMFGRGEPVRMKWENC